MTPKINENVSFGTIKKTSKNIYKIIKKKSPEWAQKDPQKHRKIMKKSPLGQHDPHNDPESPFGTHSGHILDHFLLFF